ncbi:MAG TPA: tRNA pseudouridine(55) synthase TruB [Polyangiales bacterium]|nr:tRNA pseudouridine(55) synthase TruB [Polyangiales bacterium]
MNGILVVDKPSGCTSHDVVQRVRRAVGQRSVGHAGTLDPLATGVLVVALGEATKLVSYLQLDDKRYDATIALGTETDSLDADGEVVAKADVPALDRDAVEAVLQRFLGRHPQKAPDLSAIKVGGTPLHRRARRGEQVQAPVREVDLYEAKVVSLNQERLRLHLHCGKGFFVRSLARDLARALGTLGHVESLRRTSSGTFSLDDALGTDELSREAIAARLIPMRKACEVLQRVDLTEQGTLDARHGRPIAPEVIVGTAWRDVSVGEPLALFGPDGEPVALGRRGEDGIRVVRGFTAAASDVISP